MVITMRCFDCPRMCGADREKGELGYCAQGSNMRISRIALHLYEEPPISGKHGSGTVFFCGCSLRCVFCQNREISRGTACGKEYSAELLAEEMLRLQASGAANINLVTPTHFSRQVIHTLQLVRPQLHIPIVYNTSGYERVEILKSLEGLVDVYMPDLKYISPRLSANYSSAPDYSEVAIKAICEMYRQVGEYRYGSDGMLKRGLLVRHLVLPSCRLDSMDVLDSLARIVPPDKILISLMSQYTPEFALDCEYKNLHRKITKFEYSSVCERASELGLEGFVQDISSASAHYTPKFDK